MMVYGVWPQLLIIVDVEVSDLDLWFLNDRWRRWTLNWVCGSRQFGYLRMANCVFAATLSRRVNPRLWSFTHHPHRHGSTESIGKSPGMFFLPAIVLNWMGIYFAFLPEFARFLKSLYEALWFCNSFHTFVSSPRKSQFVLEALSFSISSIHMTKLIKTINLLSSLLSQPQTTGFSYDAVWLNFTLLIRCMCETGLSWLWYDHNRMR